MGLCQDCRSGLALPGHGLEGRHPLPWWAVGEYGGALRSVLLDLKQRPDATTLKALLAGRRPPQALRAPAAMLVPVPSWKRRRDTLPELIARQFGHQLGLRQAALLEPRHPVLAQHHLSRHKRFANIDGAFRCRRSPRPDQARQRPLLIVDDILTTGATACSAARALREAGWRVAGVLCLARTPSGGSLW